MSHHVLCPKGLICTFSSFPSLSPLYLILLGPIWATSSSHDRVRHLQLEEEKKGLERGSCPQNPLSLPQFRAEELESSHKLMVSKKTTAFEPSFGQPNHPLANQTILWPTLPLPKLESLKNFRKPLKYFSPPPPRSRQRG